MPPTATIIHRLQLTPAEIHFYEREGYLLIPNLIRQEMVDPLREEVFEVLEANGVPRAGLYKASCTADKLRQCSQHRQGSLLDHLIRGADSLALVSQLLKGEVLPYMPFTAVKAAGGGGKFDFHQDNHYTRHEPALGSINLWVALVDMTPENGCLMVLPRSHQQGQWTSHNSSDGDQHQQVEVDPLQAMPMRMRAGDAVAFTRWTVHGSGANQTDQPRVAYALQYHRRDVNYFDSQTQQWKNLASEPRWNIAAVSQLGPASA